VETNVSLGPYSQKLCPGLSLASAITASSNNWVAFSPQITLPQADVAAAVSCSTARL